MKEFKAAAEAAVDRDGEILEFSLAGLEFVASIG